MSFRVSGAHNMVGQVGGKSPQKRPILIFENFVMKPANLDHRGIREIAFYEAIQATHARNKRSGYQTYCSLFGPREIKPSSVKNDFLSYFARRKEEKVSQRCCNKAKVENETKLLHRLELFTPKYFGTVEQDQIPSSMIRSGPFGIKSNSYILLNNLTSHFS